MNPVMYSTAICQRPGTTCRFIPPITKMNRATVEIAIHMDELVKAMS